MINEKITFSPDWDGDHARCQPMLLSLADCLAEVSGGTGDGLDPTIDDVEAQFLRTVNTNLPPSHHHRIKAAGLILLDLARQGWNIDTQDYEVIVDHVVGNSPTVVEEKARIRRQELIKRDEQLSSSPVRRFIENMESSRLYRDEFVSIFSLMRDGEDLARQLRELRESATLVRDFSRIIQPYIQIINSDQDKCDFTGLALADVWRYFRYTWSNQSTSVPGRSMRFLVRDRAAPHHPVMGIGAIGSPIVALTPRDQEIGWDGTNFIRICGSMPPAELQDWLHRMVDNQFEGLYYADLIEEGLLEADDLNDPREIVIARLQEESEIAKKRHQEHGSGRDYKITLNTDADCLARAKQDLFRWKRCDRLATLLRIRRSLKTIKGMSVDDAAGLLIGTPDGRWVLATLIRLRKAEVIGIDVADITVCGALPPYNAVIGGKLVSALAASPQIIEAYNKRYANQVSEIASGMAGRMVIRRPGLVLFGTTSLYGLASSQYNRIKIPCQALGGTQGFIQFKRVGKTDSFGSSQFSGRTVEALARVRAKSREGTRVHSIFGEGVSPKFRKIRDGLQTLGVPQDPFLQHARHRAIYMIPVAENFSSYLMGFEEEPHYLLPLDSPEATTRKVVDWWKDRWAIRRCGQDSVLDEIASHDLTYPVQHGARVKTPTPGSYQGALFDP